MADIEILLIRYLHITTASLWFGEVAVINFVLIPALSTYQGPARKAFLNYIFPRIFKMASVLSGITAITGVILFYYYHEFNFELLTHSNSGIAFLIAAILGALLTLFHFFMENHLARRVGVGNPNLPQEEVEDIHLKLKVVPRAGFVVISSIFILMMYSVRSF